MSFSEGAASLKKLGGCCHGYANGCPCERCSDRCARRHLLTAVGHPDAAAEAQRVSEDYFTKPWRYRRDPDKPNEPPVPLKQAA